MSGAMTFVQGVIIDFRGSDGAARICTTSRAMRRNLEELAREYPEDCKWERVSRDDRVVIYSVPRSWVEIRPPRQSCGELSDLIAELEAGPGLDSLIAELEAVEGRQASWIGKDTSERLEGRKRRAERRKGDNNNG